MITRLRALFSKRQTTTEQVDLNEATKEVLALAASRLQSNRIVLRSELAEICRRSWATACNCSR